MLVWLVFFALATWLLRRVRAFDPPASKSVFALWIVAWIVTVMGLGWWSYAAIATYRIVMQSSAAERATMAALGVHELTKELFIWVAPGIVGHVVIWTLQKRRGPA